jgi:tetratricopeptide (TPR) repeat protein
LTPHDRLALANRIYQQALGAPPSERGGLVRRAAGGDAALEELVLRLCSEAEATRTGPVPELRPTEPAPAPGDDPARAPDEDLSGQTFGRYRLLRRIGRGGMAVVYLAERADGEFEQQVALKLMARGLRDREEDRFRQERQILADARHPGIANLLDAGQAPDGRPYFVMEHVPGSPIDTFCRERGLDRPARIRLFLQVARAVEHAHQCLIVHRDLKPSNILVTGDGVAKLLDFGIAKDLDRAADDPARSISGRLFTPAWASPEQVAGAAVGVPSDVYQLGLLLYLLLTGTHAHGSVAGGALLRAILSDVPVPPSRAPQAVAGISRDLDAIVGRALDKDPAARYRSVSSLIDDLERLCSGHPVSARGGGALYRAGLFVVRHRLLVAAAGMALLATGAGLTAAWREARRAEEGFAQGRVLARALLFDVHDQVAPLRGSMRARERLLVHSLQYLDALERLTGDEPSRLAEVAVAHERVGDIQGAPRMPNLGRPQAALAAYRRAWSLRGRLGQQREQARLHVKLGQVLDSLGRSPEAEAEARLALAATAEDGTAHEVRSEAWSLLGSVLAGANRGPHSVAAYRRSLAEAEAWTRTGGGLAARRQEAMSHVRLGSALGETSAVEEAATTLRTGIAELEALAREPQAPDLRRELVTAWGRLGNVLGVPAFLNLGDERGAIEAHRAALRLAEAVAAEDGSDVGARFDLVQAHWRLGGLMASRSSGQALAHLDRAEALVEELLAESPGHAAALRRRRSVQLTRAGALLAAGRPAEAAELAGRLLELAADPGPAGHSARRGALRVLGRALVAEGRVDEGLARLDEALEVAHGWREQNPDDLYASRAVAESASDRATALLSAGQGAAARQAAEVAWLAWDEWARHVGRGVLAERARSEAAKLAAMLRQ